MHIHHLTRYIVIQCFAFTALYAAQAKLELKIAKQVTRDQLPSLVQKAPEEVTKFAQEWVSTLKKDGIWQQLHQHRLTTQHVRTIDRAIGDYTLQKGKLCNISITGNITTPFSCHGRKYTVRQPGPWHYFEHDKACLGKGWTDGIEPEDYVQAAKRGIVMPTARYQSISRIYYALQAKKRKDELKLNLIEIPNMFMIPITDTQADSVSDESYIVVQEWIDGTLLRDVNPKLINDAALVQVTKLIAAGLWNPWWHNLVVTPRGTIAPIAFEQPPSMRPIENPLCDNHDPAKVALRLKTIADTGYATLAESLHRLKKDPFEFL